MSKTSDLFKLMCCSVLCAIICDGMSAAAWSQDSSLMRRRLPAEASGGLTLSNGSLLYQKREPPKTLKLHDIVTVVVNDKSRVLSEGEVENRKLSQFNAILKDWIVFDGLAVRPDPQSEGDPRINGTLESKFRSEAELETRNALDFTIAAKVIDIRPNGNLVIEARQTFKNNEEIWERSLNGVIRREDVTPDNKVESEDIAELRVFKRELGHVRDGYRRGWFQKWYDKYQPF